MSKDASSTAVTIESFRTCVTTAVFDVSQPSPQRLRDEIALRFRIFLEAARVGTSWERAASSMGELLFQSAWLAHRGCGALSRDRIVKIERAIRSTRAHANETGTFLLDEGLFLELSNVMSMYEAQLAEAPFGLLKEGVDLMEELRVAQEGNAVDQRRDPRSRTRRRR